MLSQQLHSIYSNKIFRTSFVLMLCFITSFLQAQTNITITGVVTDGNGIAMEGVSVKIKGTTKASVTSVDGKYKIVAPSKQSILQFSYVGFLTQERGIGAKPIIDVVLRIDPAQQEEVVVVGYGTKKRKELTGTVGKANIEEMQLAPVNSFDQALAGRVAGVVVTQSDGQPGGAASIVIRGSSVSQEASPLYVIDGFAVENMDVNSINQNDIESFEILKDAASIAIYGSRGANGVILITTKKGKSGPPRLTYASSYGIQKDINRVKMMNPYEFVKLQLELDSIASTPTNINRRFAQVYLDPAKGIDLNYYKTVPGYDWQDLLLQTGSIQTHSLNLSGGNTDTKYTVSGSLFDQKGVILNSGLRKYDGRFSLSQKISSHFSTGVIASYSNTRTFGTVPASGSGGVVQGMWQYRPVNGVRNQDVLNSLFDSTALEDFFNGNATANLGDNLINPLVQAQNEHRVNITNTANLNLFVEYTFWKKFKFRVSGSYNATNLKLEQFYNSETQQGLLFRNQSGAIANVNGINGFLNNTLNENYTTSNVLSYKTRLKSIHSFDVVAGFEYQYGKSKSSSFRSINIPQATEYLGIYSMNSGTATLPLVSATHNQLYSFFGRFDYGLSDKYYLTLTGRTDGSSKFSVGKQWGFFPSIAGAWVVSKEQFMNKVSNIISFAKLRASYGSVGNNRVGDFSYLSQFGSLQNAAGYAWANTYAPGVQPFFYGNNDLTWETTTGLDLGVELGFLKDKLTFEAVYYEKKTKDFLLGVRLPYIAGYGNGLNTQYQNTGRVTNSGLEFTVSSVNLTTKNFKWTTSFNISFNKSNIDEFYQGVESIQTNWALTGAAPAWIAKVGGPISQFYGYQWGGVYQYSDFDKLANGTYVLKPGVPTYGTTTPVQPGDPKYVDITGDGVVNANDQTTLGSPLPIHTGGFSNNFSYKNFSLNVFFQWSYGNEVLNANRIVFESNGGYQLNFNQFATYANRWTPTNPTNDIPRARYNNRGDAGSTNPRPSSRVIEDASFLRLKTLALSYTLPNALLKRMKIRSVRLNLAAQNIFTITKYTGIDPEVSTFRTNNPANSPVGGTNVGSTTVGGSGYTFIQPSSGYAVLAGGYDSTPYPRAFTLTFGLNVTF